MEREKYIGSVRFFKNLILLVVIVAIGVPSGFAFRYRTELEQTQEELVQVQQQAERSLQGVSALTAEAMGMGDAPDYQQLYPDFYAPEHAMDQEWAAKTAFLTFDDGPSERTEEILEVLAEKDAKATFFVVGQTDETALQRMREIVAQGHALGMESYSKDYKKIYSSVEAYLDDMYQIFTLIRETTGQTPTLFRFPGGSLNAYDYGIYQELMAEMLRRGFVPCDWNLSAGDSDGTQVTAQQIVENVVSGAGLMERCFVRLHDDADKSATVEALGQVIDGLRQQGFELRALTPETTPVLFGYRE